MKKKQEIPIDKAKGILYFTDVLDKYSDAQFMELKRKMQDPDTKFESQVIFVSNSQKIPIYILKTGSYVLSDTEGIAQAKREYEIAYELGKNNPYIAKGLTIEEYTDTLTNTYYCEKLFEYGGSNLLEIMNTGLRNEEIIEIAKQTADAMNFTHKKGIFHSDLKPENIVYKNGAAKIIDFGVSMNFGKKTEVVKYTKFCTGKVVGLTPCYSPPEFLYLDLLKDMMPINREKIDVYSWAMIFYQLLSKKSIQELEQEWEPYRRNFETYQKFKIHIKLLKTDAFYKGKSSKKFVKIISDCLSFCSADRPTFEEIYEEIQEYCEILKYQEKIEIAKENSQKMIYECDSKNAEIKTEETASAKVSILAENYSLASTKNEIPFCKNNIIQISNENYSDEQAIQIAQALKCDSSLKLRLVYERQIIYQIINAENIPKKDLIVKLKHFKTWRKMQPEISYKFENMKCGCKSGEEQIKLKCGHKICLICGVANRVESQSLILKCEECGIKGVPQTLYLDCGCILNITDTHKTFLFLSKYNGYYHKNYKFEEIKCKAHSLSITLLESVLLMQNKLNFYDALEEREFKSIGELLSKRNVQSSLNFTLKFDEACGKSLGEYLKNTKTLSQLTFYNSEIEVGGKYIAEALEFNESLTYLHIFQSKAWPTCIKPLGESLIKNHILMHLKLHCNYFGDEGAIALGKGLSENKSLILLDLYSCGIQAIGGKAIGKALELNKTLQELNISYNNFGDEGAKAIGNSLIINNSLKVLNISNCEFGEIGTIAIGFALQRNDTLEELNIGWHKLQELAAFGDMLEINKALRKLTINISNISELAFEKIAEGLSKNNTLEKLYLQCHVPNLELHKKFTNALGKNKGLKDLTCFFGMIRLNLVSFFLKH